MKYIIFGDPHIHSYRSWDNNGSRLKYCFKAINNVFKYAEANKIDTILCAGDWYDTHHLLFTKVVNGSIALLQAWTDKAPQITLYCITGNHDLASKNIYGSKYSSGLEHLEASCSNFKVLDNSSIKIGECVNIFGVPYYDAKEDLERALQDVAAKAPEPSLVDVNILMLHNTPSNTNDPHLFADFSIHSPYFEKFAQVHCGHIHGKAVLSDKFMLTGSLLHKNPSEDAETVKGFWECTVEDGAVYMKHIVDETLPIFTYDKEKARPFDYLLQSAEDYVNAKDSVELTELRASFKKAVTPKEYIHAYWKKEGGGDSTLLDCINQFL
jgi:DNA repair exonuclease SbcCD nuclease subunit